MQNQSNCIESFYADVGTLIRQSRLEAGLTQADLASRIQMTRSSIANMEAGRQRFPLHLIAQLAEVLNSSAAQLLPTKSHFKIETPLDEATHDELDAISSTARKFVESAILAARSSQAS